MGASSAESSRKITEGIEVAKHAFSQHVKSLRNKCSLLLDAPVNLTLADGVETRLLPYVAGSPLII